MKYLFDAPSEYMLIRARNRAARDGFACAHRPLGFADGAPCDFSVAVGVKVDPPPSSLAGHDWSQVTAWLRAQQFGAYSWSPFSNEWKRYFAFASQDDLVLFYLTFHGRDVHQ